MWQVTAVYWLFCTTGLYLNRVNSDDVSHRVWMESSYCKSNGQRVSYDSTHSICCNDKLHNRTDDNQLYCCGQYLYSPDISICCDGRLHDISQATAKPQCCKRISYDADRFICCENGVLMKRRFRHTACCNNKTIDITRKVCCEGRVRTSTQGRTSCCGKRSYNPYKDTCCNRTVNRDIVTKSCCSKQAYDKSVSTCCNNHLTHRAGMQCCENKSYDQNTHTCCGGIITRKNHTTGCCCKQAICTLYNTQQQICCNGMVVPKGGHVGCCGADIYDVTMQVCCGNITLGAGPSNWRCCGNIPYNSNKQICCRNIIQAKTNKDMRCCGNKAYDPYIFQCEDYFYNHVIPINGKYCDRRVYDPDDDLCCHVSVVPKTYGQRTACCNQQVYDKDRYVCCDGVINPIPAGIPQCCRHNAYNILKNKCDVASGEIISRSNRFVRFCGAQMVEYDTRKYLCCNGTTYGPGNVCCKGSVERLPGISLGQGKCCGQYPYDNNKYICCHGNLYSNFKGNKCCGAKPYNASTHACCQGNIYPEGFTCCKGVVHLTPGVQLGKGKCCGGIGYNRKRQICCAKKVFTRKSRKMKCCGTRPYDKSRNIFICCHATLSVIGHHGRNVCCRKEPYSPILETCCRGRVHTKRNATCCGQNIYDPLKSICCSNTVYSIHKYGKDCCRKMAYNASTQVCRSGSVFPKVLCGQKIYDNRTQMCCGGRIRQKGAHIRCCVKRSYNIVKSICCNGKVRPNTRICCSNRVYSAKGFGCCGGFALRKNHPHLKCCAGQVYEVAQYRCKRNKIVAKGKLQRKMCMKESAFAFLGELQSIGRVYHSFKLLSVIKGEPNIQVGATMKVLYKHAQFQRLKKRTGQTYLLAGRIVWKDSFMMEKVFLYRPWRKKLQEKLEALVKSCHLIGAAHPVVKTRLFKAFGRM